MVTEEEEMVAVETETTTIIEGSENSKCVRIIHLSDNHKITLLDVSMSQCFR